MLEETLNNHEEAYPEHQEDHNRAMENLFSNGKFSPSKYPAVEAGITLDGADTNRDLFSDNYHTIPEEELKDVDDEVVNMGQLSAMLHHPKNILSDHGEISSNQQIAGDLLKHLLNKHGSEEGHPIIMDIVHRALLSALLDQFTDTQSAIKQLLSPQMLQNTHHHPKDYASTFEAPFMNHAVEGVRQDNWKKALPDILQQLGG